MAKKSSRQEKNESSESPVVQPVGDSLTAALPDEAAKAPEAEASAGLTAAPNSEPDVPAEPSASATAEASVPATPAAAPAPLEPGVWDAVTAIAVDPEPIGYLQTTPTPRLSGEEAALQARLFAYLHRQGVAGMHDQGGVYGWLLRQIGVEMTIATREQGKQDAAGIGSST